MDGGSGGESREPSMPASSMFVLDAGGAGADGAMGSGIAARGGNALAGFGGGGGGAGGGFIHAPGLTGEAAISPPSSDPAPAP
jgi:hypothetical protein